MGVEVGDAPSPAAPTADVKAYDLYLEARALFQARRELTAADALLSQAIAIDPGFADAFAIRAAIHQFGGEYGATLGDERAATRSCFCRTTSRPSRASASSTLSMRR